MKKSILMLSLMILLSGCDIMTKIGGAYQLAQSEYRYNSISNIQLSGLNLGDASGISLSNLATIATILSGGSGMQTIPFSLTLHMDVTNPNTTAAFLDALDYAIQINEMDFVEGKMDIPIRIEPGETKVIGVPISVDLKGLINRYSQERVTREMSGFLGITPNETSVSVKLWPKFYVGETLVKVPAPIPVLFTFGGK